MATITKYGVVNKTGIRNSGAYLVLAGWLFDTQAEAHEMLHKDAYFSKHLDQYTIAKVEYEND